MTTCSSYRQAAEVSYQQVRQKVKVLGSAVSALAAVVCPQAEAIVVVHLTDNRRQQWPRLWGWGWGAREEHWKVGYRLAVL